MFTRVMTLDFTSSSTGLCSSDTDLLKTPLVSSDNMDQLFFYLFYMWDEEEGSVHEGNKN